MYWWHIYLAAVICGAVLVGIGLVGGMILFSQWIEAQKTRPIYKPEARAEVEHMDLVTRPGFPDDDFPL